MRGRHLIKARPQQICLLCLHHLQTAGRASALTTQPLQRRLITSSSQHLRPPAQAVAQQEDSHDEQPISPPQAPPQRPQRSAFGAFVGAGRTSRATQDDSSRDAQQKVRHGGFSKRRNDWENLDETLAAQNQKERAAIGQSDPQSFTIRKEGVPEGRRPLIRLSNRRKPALDVNYDNTNWDHLSRKRNVGAMSDASEGTVDDRVGTVEHDYTRGLNEREQKAKRGGFVGFQGREGQISSSNGNDSGIRQSPQDPPQRISRTGRSNSVPTRSVPLFREREAGGLKENEQKTPRWQEKSFGLGEGRPPVQTAPRRRPDRDSGVHEQRNELRTEQRNELRTEQRNELRTEQRNELRTEQRTEQRTDRRPRPTRNSQDLMPRTMDATPRRRGKVDASSRRAEKFATSEDDIDEQPEDTRDQKKKQRQKERLERKKASAPTPIELPPFISVANLATLMKVRIEHFAEKLEELGFEDIANDHVLNAENAGLVAMEYNFEPVPDTSDVDDLRPRPPVEDLSLLQPRPPVVTIMGHVDHGKTTLLDYLRESSVAATEHGGITQHIGAFSVQLASGKQITFLDTPGHAAFLSMRQRGANVTDIVILVVAADDGVKPQTIEAIKHAKNAKVPIVVAINKVDKPEADVHRVKTELMQHEIEVEDFGGDIQAIEVSGKTGQGMGDLEEAAVTLAEILDMRAEYEGTPEGWVLEATTKKAGRVATVLVKRGTLRVGDAIVAGRTWAKVRTLKNEAGVDVQEATPGTPVEVDGWREQPVAGDEVLGAMDEHEATDVVDYRLDRDARVRLSEDSEVINEQRRIDTERHEREKKEKAEAIQLARETRTRVDWKPTAPVQDPNKPTDLYCIIKADVSGSAEAVQGTLESLPLANHKLNLKILRCAVGAVSETDVGHIDAVPAGNGFIVNFNQPIPQHMSMMAERAGIRIIDDNIIYKALDNVKEMIEDRLPRIVKSKVTGEAEIAATFDISQKKKIVKIAGCRIRNGIITLNKRARVYRGERGDGSQGELVHDGVISSLRSHKKEVSEMRKGAECGLGLEEWDEFQPGDIIQCYDEIHEKRRLM